MIDITPSAIDPRKVIASVETLESGAIDLFVGITRNQSNGRAVKMLEYEAYEPMAQRMMEQIAKQASARWNVHRIAIAHRLGTVPVGEASVMIAVSSAHRHDAFEACRFLIDELKRVVPIWKREYFEDGTVEWSRHSHEQIQAQ
ncbi:MAG: molybdenum cofactor biosynthesis protein MoaE [Bacteroidota bacterium]